MNKKDLKELQKQMPKLPKKELHVFECNDCGNTWETDEEYNIQSYCPKCRCGDINVLESILENEND